jgi:hypothetical protein
VWHFLERGSFELAGSARPYLYSASSPPRAQQKLAAYREIQVVFGSFIAAAATLERVCERAPEREKESKEDLAVCILCARHLHSFSGTFARASRCARNILFFLFGVRKKRLLLLLSRCPYCALHSNRNILAATAQEFLGPAFADEELRPDII